MVINKHVVRLKRVEVGEAAVWEKGINAEEARALHHYLCHSRVDGLDQGTPS